MTARDQWRSMIKSAACRLIARCDDFSRQQFWAAVVHRCWRGFEAA
jgi:hypothetical protein